MQSSRGRSVYNIISYRINNIRLLGESTALINDKQSLKNWQDIPGPSSLPIIGQLHHFLPGGSLYNANHAMYDILYKNYGPIVKIKFLGLPVLLIHLFDADAIEKILRGEDSLPDRPAFLSLAYYRKKYLKKGSDVEYTGLVTEQGERWKCMRTKVNQIMLQPKRVKIYDKIMDKVSEDMVVRLESKLNEKYMIDGGLRSEMVLWSLEAVAVVALGQRLNCFDPNLPSDSPVRKLVQNIHDVFYMAENLDFKPSLWRYFPTPLFKKAMKIYEKQWKLSKYFINKSIEDLRIEGNKTDDEKGILEKLLAIDESTAVLMAGDSLFAGVDTVANVMISILYLLAYNPEKQKKLRDEILYGDPKQLYLKACIKETLRLIPVVPANVRKIKREHEVLGYKIPENSVVILNHEVLCKMERHFPRANEFIPERWIVGKNDPLYYGNAHPFIYNPFGYGTRSCIGRRIAKLEMESFLARIIKTFKIYWDGPPAKLEAAISIYIVGDLPFVFKKIS